MAQKPTPEAALLLWSHWRADPSPRQTPASWKSHERRFPGPRMEDCSHAGRGMADAMTGVETSPQIKSRERVRDLAEVYTHRREVEAMLDLVADMFPSDEEPENIDRTFLEPACGSGNFLVAILARKLAYVTTSRYGQRQQLEYAVLRCVASIYGIDICAENVEEARDRMEASVRSHLAQHLSGQSPTVGFWSALEVILATNVIRADTLADAAEIELIEYEPVGEGTFVRTWSRPLNPSSSDLSLFSLPDRHDEMPAHYADLSRLPEPVSSTPLHQKAA